MTDAVPDVWAVRDDSARKSRGCVPFTHYSIYLFLRTRGIIVGPQLASFVCVLVSLVCQQPMRRLC